MNAATLPEPQPQLWRALLLHRLPDEQAQALEQRLLAEPLLLDALHDAEHELFDDYAAARLDADERLAFEQHRLTTPEDRDRLRLSRALLRLRQPAVLPRRRMRFESSAGPASRSRRSPWIALAGGALAAGLALIAVFGPSALTTHRDDATLRVPRDGEQAATPTLVLTASVARGVRQSEPVPLVLGKDATQLRVQAEIEQPQDAMARYRLSVYGESGAGQPLLRADSLALLSAGRYRYVEALLPSSLFAGDATRIIRIESLPPAMPFTFEWSVHGGAGTPG